MKFQLLVPILLLVALGLGACSKGEDTAAQQGSSDTGAPAAEAVKAEPAAPSQGH